MKDKNQVINTFSLVFLFIFFPLFMMFLDSKDYLYASIFGLLFILCLIRLLIVYIIFYKNRSNINNKIKDIRNKNVKNGFETLLIKLKDKENLDKYFNSNLEYSFNIVNVDDIEFKYVYNEYRIVIHIKRNLIMTKTDTIISNSLTIDDLMYELNNVIKDENNKIENYITSYPLDYKSSFYNERINNVKTYISYSKTNVIMAIFCTILFTVLLILFILDKEFENENPIALRYFMIGLFVSMILLFTIIGIASSLALKWGQLLNKDIKNNTIVKANFTPTKIKFINVKYKNGKIKVLGLKVYNGKEKYIIPFRDINKLYYNGSLKNYFNENINLSSEFTYYKESKVVIENNHLYEELAINYLKK